MNPRAPRLARLAAIGALAVVPVLACSTSAAFAGGTGPTGPVCSITANPSTVDLVNATPSATATSITWSTTDPSLYIWFKVDAGSWFLAPALAGASSGTNDVPMSNFLGFLGFAGVVPSEGQSGHIYMDFSSDGTNNPTSNSSGVQCDLTLTWTYYATALPGTGVNTTPYVVTGLALLVAGGVIVLANRRRRAASV